MDEKPIAEAITSDFDELFPAADGDCDIPSHCFGFYDWFCPDDELREKARRLFSILCTIAANNAKGMKFDPSKCYAFFKNNCPCYGDELPYDDIRICDIESGGVLFNVCPKDPYGKTMLYCEGHGFDNDTDGIEFNGVGDLARWFASNNSIENDVES